MRDLEWVIDACHHQRKPETEELRQALDEIARTPAGRIVLADLFVECHLLQPTLAEDPVMTATLEGMRRVATRLFNHLVAGASDEEIPKETET